MRGEGGYKRRWVTAFHENDGTQLSAELLDDEFGIFALGHSHPSHHA